MNYTSLTNPVEARQPGGGGLEAGYRALTETAGVRLCAERLVIRMSGDDRASFLHGMCSNDINGLKPGYLVPALFLTERAHLIGEANVWAVADALLGLPVPVVPAAQKVCCAGRVAGAPPW